MCTAMDAWWTVELDGLSFSEILSEVSAAQSRGDLHASIPSGRGTRRVPVTSKRLRVYLSSKGIRTAWGSDSTPKPRRGSARARRRPGRRVLARGSEAHMRRGDRNSGDQAWYLQANPGVKRSRAQRIPAEVRSKRPDRWIGKKGHLSVVSMDVCTEEGGPPAYDSARWTGFTFRRGGDVCTVVSVGDAEVACTAVRWPSGTAISVHGTDLHKAWSMQRMNRRHCDCRCCTGESSESSSQSSEGESKFGASADGKRKVQSKLTHRWTRATSARRHVSIDEWLSQGEAAREQRHEIPDCDRCGRPNEQGTCPSCAASEAAAAAKMAVGAVEGVRASMKPVEAWVRQERRQRRRGRGQAEHEPLELERTRSIRFMPASSEMAVFNQGLVKRGVRLPAAWGGHAGRIVKYCSDTDEFNVRWNLERGSTRHRSWDVRQWLICAGDRDVEHAEKTMGQTPEERTDELVRSWAHALRRGGQLLGNSAGVKAVDMAVTAMVGCAGCARRVRAVAAYVGRPIWSRDGEGHRDGGWIQLYDYFPGVDQIWWKHYAGSERGHAWPRLKIWRELSRAAVTDIGRAGVEASHRCISGGGMEKIGGEPNRVDCPECADVSLRSARCVWTKLGLARRRRVWRPPKMATALRSIKAIWAAVADVMDQVAMRGECDLCCLRTWATAPMIGRRRRDGRVVAYDPKRHRFRLRRADGSQFWMEAAKPVTEARFAYSSTEVWETARDGQVPSLGAGSGRGGGRCPCLRPDGQWSGEDRFWVPLGVSQTSGLRSRGLWAPVLEGEGGATVLDRDV